MEQKLPLFPRKILFDTQEFLKYVTLLIIKLINKLRVFRSHLCQFFAIDNGFIKTT